MQSSPSNKRGAFLVWALISLAALGAVAVIALQNSDSGLSFFDLGEEPAASEGGSRQTDSTGDDAPVTDSVEGFTDEHGNPPNTDFARMRIPAINVDAPVGRWIVDSSIMPEPYGPVDVAFYDLSGWPGLGGFPGEGGNAVFAAHVDLNRYISYADDTYRGPAVFWDLEELTPGSIVEVDYAGQTLRYSVVWTEQVPASGDVDWGQYFGSGVAVDSITLYTCGGEFDSATASYTHRVIVRAERIS